MDGVHVVTESIGSGLHRIKRFHIGLLLRRIGPARYKRHRHFMTGISGGLLNTGTTTQYDQIGQ